MPLPFLLCFPGAVKVEELRQWLHPTASCAVLAAHLSSSWAAVPALCASFLPCLSSTAEPAGRCVGLCSPAEVLLLLQGLVYRQGAQGAKIFLRNEMK